MSAWESNRALNERILRIRREGREPLFLKMQTVAQPRVHASPSSWISFYFFSFGGGREWVGEKKKK